MKERMRRAWELRAARHLEDLCRQDPPIRGKVWFLSIPRATRPTSLSIRCCLKQKHGCIVGIPHGRTEFPASSSPFLQAFFT